MKSISAFKQVLKTTIASLIFVFLFLPFFFNLHLVNSLLTSLGAKEYIVLTIVNLFSLILLWKSLASLFRRSDNTHKVDKGICFTYPELVLLFFDISLLLLLVFNLDWLLLIPKLFLIFFFSNLLIDDIYLLINYLSSRRYPQQSVSTNETALIPVSISDEPIKSKTEDVLRRETFIEGLVREIARLPFTDSFVFGLYGNWGEGKTSVINLLKDKFLLKTNFIVVSFDPWYFSDETAILTAFYKQLETAIGYDFLFPDLKKAFIKYKDIISMGVAKVGFSTDFFSKYQESLEDVKNRIQGYIKKTDKKILIIIDDIDRLTPQEILLIFKMVQLNMRFENTRFLLSFDYGIVVEKIKKHVGEKPDEYLKKIIQQPLKLPKIEQRLIDFYFIYSDHDIPQHYIEDKEHFIKDSKISLCGRIKSINDKKVVLVSEIDNTSEVDVSTESSKVLSNLKLHVGDKIFASGVWDGRSLIVAKPGGFMAKFRLSLLDLLFYALYKQKKIDYQEVVDFNKEFISLYNEHLHRFFPTLRDAKRYFNNLTSSLSSIAEETNLFDFCLLELIKVNKEMLYNDIYSSWWIYVERRNENDAYTMPFGYMGERNEEYKNKLKKEHIDKFFADNPTVPIMERLLRIILKKLFPKLERVI